MERSPVASAPRNVTKKYFESRSGGRAGSEQAEDIGFIPRGYKINEFNHVVVNPGSEWKNILDALRKNDIETMKSNLRTGDPHRNSKSR